MCFMPYPTKPKGGWQRPCQVVVNKSTEQIREKKATQKFANKYRDIFQNNMAEGPKDPQGPFFYQEGGKTYASLPVEMLQNIQKSPLFKKMQKDCKAEGIEIPKTIMAKDPVTHVLTPQEYLRNVKPLLLMQNHLPQLQMRKPMLRYQVGVTLQIVIQRSNNLPEPSHQPVEESTDLLTEYQQVTRRMTLGTTILILMSTHTRTT